MACVSVAGLVFRRELREAWRDKRALFVDYVIPFLLWPTLFWVYGQVLIFLVTPGEGGGGGAADGGSHLADVLGGVLPVGLPFLLLVSLFHPLVDSTAGEKERGTLATLLVTGVRPVEVLLGKFWAVFLMGLAGVFVNLASVAIFAPGDASPFGKLGLGEVVWLLALYVPLAGVYAAVGLALFSVARSYKEGKSYFAPYLLGMLAPVFLCLLPQVPVNLWTMVVPGLNTSLLTAGVLRGEVPSALSAGTVIAVNAFFTVAVLTLAARVFGSERNRFADMPQKVVSESGGVPGVGGLVFLLGLAFLLPGVVLEKSSPFLGLIGAFLVLQVVGFGVVPVVVARFSGWSRKLCLPMGGEKLGSFLLWLGVMVMGVSLWPMALLAGTVIMPSADFLKQMMGMLGVDERPLWQLILFFAIVPAVCEEVLFRGPIFAALRARLPGWAAVLVNGVVFGLAHGILRALPTGLVGVVCAWLRLRSSSIVPGMVFHALHNTVSLVFVKVLVNERGEKFALDIYLLVAVAVVVFASGVGMFLWGARSSPGR